MTSSIARVNRTKEAARASYDRLARWYDFLSGSSERKHAEAGLALLSARAGERILEIGFGTGHVLVELARAVGSGGRVSGLDLSPKMGEVARARVARSENADRVTIITGDALTLPFDSGSLDAVFMSFTLELFDTPEILPVLLECRRVLCDGGRICIVSLSRHVSSPAESLYEWFHERLPALVDCRPILVKEAVVEAGLQVEESRMASMWGLPVETVLARKQGAAR